MLFLNNLLVYYYYLNGIGNLLSVPFIVRLHSCRIEARQSGLRAK